MGFSASSYYQAVRDAELLTVVCLPEKEGKYPVMISMRCLNSRRNMCRAMRWK